MSGGGRNYAFTGRFNAGPLHHNNRVVQAPEIFARTLSR
jgi:hypothetical protein